MLKPIIACVLRIGGGVYDNGYVNALANATRKHSTIDHDFVCLTDSQEPFCENVTDVIQLRRGFPGWWSKMELFNQPSFSGRTVVFIDLDTVIVGNIDFLLSHEPRVMMALNDFYTSSNLGSGLMVWRGGQYDAIYREFMKNPVSFIRNTPTGDQTFIESIIGHHGWVRLQSEYPKEVVSYKKHCRQGNNDSHLLLPDDARVICFHGVPKPHNIIHPLIANNWSKGVDSE